MLFRPETPGLVGPDGLPLGDAHDPGTQTYGLELYETADGTGVDGLTAIGQVAELRKARASRGVVLVRAGQVTPTLVAEAELFGAEAYAWHVEQRELSDSEQRKVKAAALKKERKRQKHAQRQ